MDMLYIYVYISKLRYDFNILKTVKNLHLIGLVGIINSVKY